MTGNVILISGTSHTGKSTFAAAIGAALDWPVVSTDGLARHPGRPWPKPRPHVAEVYSTLSTPSLVTLLQHHHSNLRPLLVQRIAEGPVILEGNAVRPEFWPQPKPTLQARICLQASPDVLWDRMIKNAGESAVENVSYIKAFWKRSVADQRDLVKTATAHSWSLAALGDAGALDELVSKFVSAARR